MSGIHASKVASAKSIAAVSALACIGVLLAGCNGSTVHTQKKLGTHDVLLTSADIKSTMSVPVEYNEETRRINPTRVFCAEPSPDVAKAVQESFGFGGGAAVDIPTQGSGTVAISIAKARAEAAAQLGERLATIQLLRDGLYRACEAYANGAFNEVTYAVLLSRYDDTMVTMLMGELAAGAFGRELATLGGGSSAEASSDADLQGNGGSSETTGEAEAIAVSGDTPAVPPAENGGDQDGAEDVSGAGGSAGSETEARSNAHANEPGALDEARRENAVEVANVIHQIQRKYIENINSDALVVACITALANQKSGQNTELSDLCSGDDGIIRSAMAQGAELLKLVKRRPVIKRDHETLTETIAEIKKMREELNSLDDAGDI